MYIFIITIAPSTVIILSINNIQQHDDDLIK